MEFSQNDLSDKGSKHLLGEDLERPTKKRVLPTFPILPNNRFGTSTAPTLRHPLFIGDFSLDESRKFHHDKRNLSFITIDWDDTQGKKVEFDLNQSMDKVRRKNYKECNSEKLDRLLMWILLNRYKFAISPAPQQQHKQLSADLANKTLMNSNQSTRSTSIDAQPNPLAGAGPITSLSTDFVCFRGLLRDLMCCPYQREGWIILATKFRRTIYLCAVDSVEKQMEKEKETENQKRMCSWGHKFEHFMTDGADPTEGHDENKEYCCVLRSRLALHSLVYGAEVDGADPTRYNPPHAHLTPFVELKTTKEIVSDRQKQILHKFKFQKWWSQSFLVGIPRVVCGFRDDSGVVRSLQTFAVSTMPTQCQDYWSTDVMINFVDQFLSWVKTQVVEDDPNLVYQLTRPPGSPDVQCQCLGGNSSAVAFLPQWYVKEIFASND